MSKVWVMRLSGYALLCLALLMMTACRTAQCSAGSIHDAAAEGDLATVKSILNKNCMALNQRDFGGSTPLIMASMHGQKQVVDYLLSKGADVNARDNNGRTAIFWAAQNGEAAIVQLLIQKGASAKDRDLLGWTPLHGAAMLGQTDMVPLLTEKYADVNARDFRGRTPVDLAQTYERRDTEKMLRKHGARALSPAALPLLAAGAFIFMIGYIWIVVAAFITNVWWGIVCIFFPVATPLYVIFNVNSGWRPFVVILAGTALIIWGFFSLGLF